MRDASGALVPAATVTLVNQGTQARQEIYATSGGAFEFTDVKIGQYRITARAAGFSLSTTEPFTVQVNARQRVDVSLRARASETQSP